MENTQTATDLDERLLQIAPNDNVAVAKTTLRAGTALSVAGQQVVLADDVATGHKVALVTIDAGAKVIKYGAPIGSATCTITPGEAVHAHNVKSDYLPTYTLDGRNPYLYKT